MFNWIRNLFKSHWKKYLERTEKSSLSGGDLETYRAEMERMVAKDKEEHEKMAAKAKEEWEDRNELEKKLDACYLGARKKAFYGTYEEYLAEKGKIHPFTLTALQDPYYQQVIANAHRQSALQSQMGGIGAIQQQCCRPEYGNFLGSFFG